MCPAIVPAASRFQASGAQPYSAISGASTSPGSVERPLTTMCGALAAALRRRGTTRCRRWRRARGRGSPQNGRPSSRLTKRNARRRPARRAARGCRRRSPSRSCRPLAPLLARDRDQRVAAAVGVDAAGVRDDADPLLAQAWGGCSGSARRSRSRSPACGIALPRLLHDRHRDFGEVVERQVVERALLDEAARRVDRIAPEPLAVGDAQRRDPSSSTLRSTPAFSIGVGIR